jgi:hypothetical protein
MGLLALLTAFFRSEGLLVDRSDGLAAILNILAALAAFVKRLLVPAVNCLNATIACCPPLPSENVSPGQAQKGESGEERLYRDVADLELEAGRVQEKRHLAGGAQCKKSQR